MGAGAPFRASKTARRSATAAISAAEVGPRFDAPVPAAFQVLAEGRG